MSTFYLLPPRPLLAARIADVLRTWLPGLDGMGTDWASLADTLGGVASRHADVYLVYREELPEGEDATRALMDGFGAEPGDEIVEVRLGGQAGDVSVRRWRLDGPAC